MIDVCLLGTGGTMPLPERALTSLSLRYNGSTLLVDCGEGTQVQLRKKGLSIHDIDVILITHFHADHVMGLCGLLLSMAKCERREPVDIVAPKGAAHIVKSLCVAAPAMPFELRITEIGASYKELSLCGLKVCAQLAEHSVTCYGYSFTLDRQGRFDPQRARELDIDVKLWKLLQRGESVESSGRLILPEMVMGAPRKGLKVTYCTDTRPTEKLCALAKGSDLLIFEGMYAEDEKLNMAKEKKHSLFSEAADIAKRACVRELWLTHFSPSLPDPYKYEEYVRGIFENTVIPQDLQGVELKFD